MSQEQIQVPKGWKEVHTIDVAENKTAQLNNKSYQS